MEPFRVVKLASDQMETHSRIAPDLKEVRLMSTERGCVSSIALAKEDGKAQPQHIAGTQGDGNKVSAAAGL
jgi:hypothetical protein